MTSDAASEFSTQSQLKRSGVVVCFTAMVLTFCFLGCADVFRADLSSRSEYDNRLVIASPDDSGVSRDVIFDLKKQIQEIKLIAWASWVGGYNKINASRIFNLAVSDNYFDVYPEYKIDRNALVSFQRKTNAAIVGRHLAEKNRWQVGQHVLLTDVPFVNRSTSDNAWDYEIVAMFDMPDDSRGLEIQFFSRWSYLQETAFSADSKAGWLVASLSGSASTAKAADEIDLTTKGTESPTHTQTERAFQRRFTRPISLAVCAAMATALLLLWLMMGKLVKGTMPQHSSQAGRADHFEGNQRSFVVFIFQVFALILAAGCIGMLAATALLAQFGNQPESGFILPAVGYSNWRTFLVFAITLSILTSYKPAQVALRLGKRARLSQATLSSKSTSITSLNRNESIEFYQE